MNMDAYRQYSTADLLMGPDSAGILCEIKYNPFSNQKGMCLQHIPF